MLEDNTYLSLSLYLFAALLIGVFFICGGFNSAFVLISVLMLLSYLCGILSKKRLK